MEIEAVLVEQFEGLRGELVALLFDAVASGASLGFLESLDETEANAYWNDVKAAMQAGSRLLFLAIDAGAVCGTVQLELCMKKNGVNRAEVQKLMVLRAARGKGVGRRLMEALEAEARQRDRGLLYLDTEAGSVAEPFYQALGYTFLGGLPEYACSPQGEWRANAIYFKTLVRRNPQ